ncbi:MAG TPA: SCO family protein [Thermoanaerobaculia bacterium]|nr:SCO family protein [Thermoanaerobaculia bacterium]
MRRTFVLLGLFLAIPALGQPAMPSPVRETTPPAREVPTPLKNVGYDQKLGASLPLSTLVRDEAARTVRLGEFFTRRPVVFALAYFRCPMLCNVVLDDLAATLKIVPFTAGKDYDVVVVSFDPQDTAALAAAKKNEIVARYGKRETAPAWHFLTAGPESIAAITRAVGFRYYWDPETHQFAHAAGIVLLTPQGRISRYFYGVEFPARDVRLGLVEASGERIGSAVDQVLLFCFHYNPVIGRYSAVIMNIVRLGGAVTVIGLLLLVVLLRLRESHALGRA